MRRQIGPMFFVALLLGGVGGFAYFSNNPDSPWLERAEPWPVVGAAASWFRAAYLGPEGEGGEAGTGEARSSDAPPSDASSPRAEGVDPSRRRSGPTTTQSAPATGARSSQSTGERASRPDATVSQRGRVRSETTPSGPESIPPREEPDQDALLRAAGLRRAPADPATDRRRVEVPNVDIIGWELVRPGLDVRSEASPTAPSRLELESISHLPVLSRRGDWAQVLVRGAPGWIDLTQEPPHNRRRARRGILRHRAEPVQSNDGFVLKAARKLLDIKKATGTIGSYALYSDVDDAELLAFLDRAASLAEEAYFARYGRLPSGNPRRSVLLFARESTYRELAEETSNLPGGGNWQAGHAARGVLGFFVEGRDRESLAGTLVHEIAHLLNDRSLAYSLPLWLEEGIASDLGTLWMEPDPQGRQGNRIQVRGADARYLGLEDLFESGKVPPLALLLGLDRETFYQSSIRRDAYDLSFAFVRYLLDGDDARHADGFRAFLANIAAGLNANLIEQLGIDGAELEAGFYRWLEVQVQASRADIERRLRGG